MEKEYRSGMIGKLNLPTFDEEEVKRVNPTDEFASANLNSTFIH